MYEYFGSSVKGANISQKVRYFLIDQLLHIIVILVCWLFTFRDWNFVRSFWQKMNTDQHYWIVLTAFVFLTSPAGILIGQLTRQWSKKIDDPENSLANAGKWIGIGGLLIAAKGIIRFSEKDRQEVKTEYLVIGTLVSIGIAILTGLVVKKIG